MLEEQVATELSLVHRVSITKVALFLLFQVQGKAQAGRVEPTLANLAQLPYRVGERKVFAS